jgi:hypothetical protein
MSFVVGAGAAAGPCVSGLERSHCIAVTRFPFGARVRHIYRHRESVRRGNTCRNASWNDA